MKTLKILQVWDSAGGVHGSYEKPVDALVRPDAVDAILPTADGCHVVLRSGAVLDSAQNKTDTLTTLGLA